MASRMLLAQSSMPSNFFGPVHFRRIKYFSIFQTILGCTLAYSLSVALLLSTPACFVNQDSLSQKSTPTTDTKSIPAMSFVGQIGHSEYSLKISQSVRKRETRLQGSLLALKTNDLPSVNLNETTELTNHTGIGDGSICGNCGTNRITLDRKGSLMTAQFSSPMPERVSGITCGLSGNDTVDAQVLVNSLSRVMSFMKLPFHNRSWFYGSVRFPVWENSYSDILIGFSTSCTSAAA